MCSDEYLPIGQALAQREILPGVSFAYKKASSKMAYSFSLQRVIWFARTVLATLEGALSMEWTTPQHEEIELNCEVSSYANAEL